MGRAWNGSLALDATFVGTWARGAGKRTPQTRADPDAWWWGRHEDHLVPDPDKVDLKAVDSDGKRLYKFGFDVELAIAGPDDPRDFKAFPYLVMGMTVHRPGFTPAKFATDVLASIRGRHGLADPETGEPLHGLAHPDGADPDQHPGGWIACDRAYTSKKWEDYALPVRALGYRPVSDYKTGDLGRQAEHKGMLLVEGRWYSPSIPDKLIEATKDYKVRHVIDKRTYTARIAARKGYEMRNRGRGQDPNDRWYACPAEGKVGTHKPPLVACDEKTPSLVLLGMPKTPLKVSLQSVAGEIPDVCKSKAVLLHAGVHAKH